MTRQEINELKNIQYTKKFNLESQLADTDYRVIKNAEAIAAGEEPPYSPQELHSRRQPLRDDINACEAEIERLDGIVPEDEKEE